ncbi:nitrite reductase (NAD(P)H) small subunit, partial [Mycobacterium sp. 852013-50091_SCH5140682]|uniref:nitrite reductase (NAD(P)H) small subunit n=1 Tax=Mycobacterium sp. 852013-50091_SCH5140682 TaxID=1834109 RepID=UPI0018D3B104
MTLLDDRNEVYSRQLWDWTTACRYDYLMPCRGVAVLLPDGSQVALFRLDDGTLHAVGNIDPFSGCLLYTSDAADDR